MGCILFEVISGNVLFNTKKHLSKQTENLSDDQYHLFQMYSYFGPIPKDIIDKCNMLSDKIVIGVSSDELNAPKN